MRRALRSMVVVLAALVSAAIGPAQSASRPADLALILAFDISSSVDDTRYQLQLEGMAAALEDPEVVTSILGGPSHRIQVLIVAFADHPQTALPWVEIASLADAQAVARSVRALPHLKGHFTCVAEMMRVMYEKVVPQIPATTRRVVIDVSGDGADDCNPKITVDVYRDALAKDGVTINGLPILDGDEALTLESWYRDHVMGGPQAFLVPALGYDDFPRALRKKFVIEMSAGWPGNRAARSAQ